MAEQEINSEPYTEIITNYGLGSGRISYSDFLIATLDWKSVIEHEALWGAFCRFDKDQDGTINLQDIKQALVSAGCQFSDLDFELMVGEFSRLNQSKISFEEFKQLMLLFSEDNQNDSSPLLIKRRTFNPGYFIARVSSQETAARLLSIIPVSRSISERPTGLQKPVMDESP